MTWADLMTAALALLPGVVLLSLLIAWLHRRERRRKEGQEEKGR